MNSTLLTNTPLLVRWGLPVVGELQVEAEVLRLQERDHGLQLVPALALHPELVALNLGLGLEPAVPDRLGDRLGLLVRDAALDRDDLPHRAAQGLLHLAVGEGLERDVPLDELGLEDLEHRVELVLVVRENDHLPLLLLERQLGL